MVDIVISVAAKIAKYLVAPVGRPFRYLWNYKTNLENLKNEVEKLEAKRDTVQSLIKPGEDPLPDVKLWWEKANRIIVEVSGVVGDNPEQANIQCCKGFSCPNLMNRCQLSKKAADKLKDVVGLEQEAVDFNEVSKPTIPEQTTLRPRKGDEAFESRKSTLKDIIDALRDPDVNMVGIYGMGGVGKTTLAKEVALEAKQHNLFDKTVFVEVSESSEIKNIQGVIAENLGLQFKEETVLGRANRLCDQLKKEGKILLILDNIWKRINLEEVGIPFENDHKGLKLLLTTRSRDVLTNQMESERNFPVHTLTEEEAWSLFKNTAGTCVNHPDLQCIAFEIVRKCGGMPLAIVAIAKALKNKEEYYVWKNALKELRNPSSESFERTMTKEVYTCIKFSYDSLDTDELKKIFLLCSHIGRTYDASIRDLFMYGLGLGFFNGSNTLENAQCKVEDLVKKLKDNSLLLDAPNETSESHSYNISDGERFAMHDVICDVARSIAREKGQVCPMTNDGISCSWAKKNILKNCNSITLHNIGELPKDLKLALPQLEFFYMKTTNALSRITDDFFSEMPSLLVLHLIEMNLSPLPTSFSHLVNLQTLCLDKCKLGDIADIGKLEKLEILSFRGSKIRELPEEIRRLANIKLLDLNCSELEIIPQKFLSCFTQLEALYMYNSLIMWEGRGVNIGRILDELKHLRDRLTTLEISIPNVKMSEGLLSPQLKRYKISIDRNRISPPKNSRTLRVKLNTNDNADEVISQLKGIKQLELVADSRDDFTDSKQSVSLGALFSLESLSLRELNFEKICNVPLAAESFCQLRTITVHRCDKLTNIFSFSIDKVLPKLQEIEVSSCKNMEGIFAIEREDDVNNSELIHEIQFSQLCSVSLTDLPQLKSFCHRVKTTPQLQLASSTNDGEIISEDMTDIPKSLFNEKVVFPNLETLKIEDISAKKIWHNQLPTMSSSFQNLNCLVLESCHNLKELFPSSMVNRFLQLQYLEISECALLEEVVFMEELQEEERKDTQFPLLKEMIITYCPNFKGFISNGKIGFPSLKAMVIGNCDKFKEFIFNDKVAVPKIEELRIYYMDNLEKIWHNQLANDSFCKLKSLEVYDCKKLLNVFSSNIYGRLLSLESLTVNRCDSLEEIFDLRELSIYDSQIMLSFESLQKLEVSHCRRLKNLFSASILAKEGVVMEEAPARFLFLKLTSFKLIHLPELRSFYPGRHKVEGPVLKKLELSDCGIHDTDEEGQMQQPSFFSLVKEAFPCLEELSLDGKQVTMLSQGQFPESRFERLQILRVNYDHKLISPFGIIQRCQNLEELSLSESHYKEIFPHVKDQTPTKIKTLYLSYLDDLKCIWKQNSKLDLIIQHLEVLKVDWCHNLINLMPPPTSFQNPSTSFQNLTSLKVEGCDSLINMGTSTVAKSLVQLTEMSISSCKMLTEVIGNHGDVIEDEIIFRKLKGLMLEGLPSLTSFCSWNFTLKFPSLETLTVQRCPNLKIFSQGDLTTEKLQEVEIAYKSVELRLDFDLNTAIQQSYEKANSAKDNGASSSHHFEIDQESIQQSYKEAKQSHEEAAFPCLEVDDSYASEDGELSRTDVPITSLSSPPETSKISNEDSSTKQEGASEIHLKTTESSFSRTDVPITSLSSPPETSKISNEDSSTKQEGASEIPLKMTESSFSRIDVPITSLSSPPETSKISNEDSSTKQEGASEIPLKMTESSSDTDDPINIRYSQISSLESLKVSEISQLLKLPPRLHTLKIVGCDALKSLPEELKLNNIHLQQLYIIDCCVLESFSVDHLPTTLKSLYIRNCRKLKFPSTSETKQHALLEHLCIGSSCDSLSSFHLTLFPELRSLAIWDCVNFSSISISKNHMSLDALEIRDCPKLLSFLEEELHTPNLTSIFLSNCKNLKEIPKLISLRSFFINGCPELSSSSIIHGCFPENLSSLCITYCHKLTPSIQWKMHELNNLSCFEIEGGCIDLKSFPEQNLLPSSLNSLRISRLSNLEFLDYKGLECLASLETLKINGCDKLQSFPEEGLPSSVTYLYINECPLLKAKFQNRRGKEWYKIAHVTHIQIDEEVIS